MARLVKSVAQTKARKVEICGDRISVRTLLRSFSLARSDVSGFRIVKIPSMYDEIGIELRGARDVLVTERVAGFFELAEFIGVEKAFGPLWYRDAEDGRQLEK